MFTTILAKKVLAKEKIQVHSYILAFSEEKINENFGVQYKHINIQNITQFEGTYQWLRIFIIMMGTCPEYFPAIAALSFLSIFI